MRRLSLTLALVLLAAAAACSTYYYDYDYTPRPHETQLKERPDPAVDLAKSDRLLARVLTAVIGVQRPSEATGNRPRIHMRVLVENLTEQPMTLDTTQCQLTTADLLSLSPIAEPGPNPEIAPGSHVDVNLYYPLPCDPDDVNLGGLNLKWAVTLNGIEVTRSSAFERLAYAYGPYYYDDGFAIMSCGFCW